MSAHVLYIIAAVILDGVAGLAGGVLPAEFVHKHLATFLAFAAGTLIGVALINLLPEALTTGAQPHATMLAALAGFAIFYVVESLLGSHATGQSGHKHSTIGPLILVGDALHNATDGVAIAAAFLADPKTGIATTLAVIVHELPQEIGDYSILVSHGYSRGQALFYLFLVQLSALVGALAALLASNWTTLASPYLMAISAGGFIYVAAADLLPELHRQKPGGALGKLASFGAGLGIIALLEYVVCK